jgi:two-component SAPR family response regulator
VLVALGGRDVSRARVIEALWPEADGDAAVAALNMALKRLRELLGDPLAVTLAGRKLTLDARRCWVDVWTFERALGAPVEGSCDQDRAIGLYRGPFLAAEDAAWAHPLRERLRVKALDRIRRLAKHSEERQQWVEAIGCYERGLAIDDLTEEFYQRLMLCHDRLGQRGEAMGAYRRCKRCLGQHRLAPSQKTERIFAQVTGRSA